MTSAPEAPPSAWRNRITRYEEAADPSTLIPNDKNWRTHPASQRYALGTVMDEVGIVQVPTVNERTGRLVDGHLRLEMALQRGETAIPVLYVDLSEEEESLILASMDPLSAMAGVNKDTLETLLLEINRNADGRLSELLEDIARQYRINHGPPNTNADHTHLEGDTPPIAERGQIWLLGKHRVMCGDSTSTEDVALLMNGRKAALLATDPPYLVGYDAGNHPQSYDNQVKGKVNNKQWDDYVDPATSIDFFANFLTVALEHLEPRAAIYQWHAAKRQKMVEQAWEKAGLFMHQQIIWVKARAVLTRSHYMWQHEPCFYGWRVGGQPKLKPPSNETTVWTVDQKGEQDDIHPTQKPVELFRRPILYHTRQRDVCFEPFLGSGTCLIAAEALGRTCYAMELAPRFVDASIARWEAATGGKAVLETSA